MFKNSHIRTCMPRFTLCCVFVEHEIYSPIPTAGCWLCSRVLQRKAYVELITKLRSLISWYLGGSLRLGRLVRTFEFFVWDNYLYFAFGRTLTPSGIFWPFAGSQFLFKLLHWGRRWNSFLFPIILYFKVRKRPRRLWNYLMTNENEITKRLNWHKIEVPF